MLLWAVQRQFAVNASVGEGVMIEPGAEEPFPTSRTRGHVVSYRSDGEQQHPRDGKHKGRFVSVKELLS